MEGEEQTRRAEATTNIEKKRRTLDRQRIERQISIEKAKLKVYDEEERSSQRLYTVEEDTISGVNSVRSKQRIPSDVGKNTYTDTNAPRVMTPAYTPSSPKGDLAEIVQALTTTVNLNRLPTPEPPVFNGDPLQYPDWEASFSALIESRGIPPG